MAHAAQKQVEIEIGYCLWFVVLYVEFCSTEIQSSDTIIEKQPIILRVWKFFFQSASNEFTESEVVV